MLFKILGGFAASIVFFMVFVLLAPYPKYKQGFNNLTELNAFAKTISEDTKMDGKNYFKPVYETYYKKHFSPSLWRTIKSKFAWIFYSLGLTSDPLFSASFVKKLLIKVADQRHEKGFKQLHVEKIALTEQSKIVVFGYVQGAFHSFVRYLNKIKELGIIDDQFKVTNSEYYLVFKGNVTNRSPYSMELLGLVLRLVERNPENVFYLRGSTEFFRVWKQHTLRRELALRASHLSASKIPLQDEVNTFFDSLPLVLYATAPFLSKDTVDYIKIKPYFKRKFQKLATDSRYSKFLAEKNTAKIDQFILDKKTTSEGDEDNIALKAIVTAIRKRESYENTDGLRLLPSIDDVTAWNVLSCPSEPYRISIKFFHDAFAVITAAKDMDDWKITLYNRDIRKKDDLTFKTRTHHFFDGRLEGKAKEDSSVLKKPANQLGQSVPGQPVQQVQQQSVQQVPQQPILQPVQQPMVPQVSVQVPVQQQTWQQPHVQIPVQVPAQQQVPVQQPAIVRQPLHMQQPIVQQPAYVQQIPQQIQQQQVAVQQPVMQQQVAQPQYYQQQMVPTQSSIVQIPVVTGHKKKAKLKGKNKIVQQENIINNDNQHNRQENTATKYHEAQEKKEEQDEQEKRTMEQMRQVDPSSAVQQEIQDVM